MYLQLFNILCIYTYFPTLFQCISNCSTSIFRVCLQPSCHVQPSRMDPRLFGKLISQTCGGETKCQPEERSVPCWRKETHVCIYVIIYICIYVFMYVCIYLCIYVCVCVYVCRCFLPKLGVMARNTS